MADGAVDSWPLNSKDCDVKNNACVLASISGTTKTGIPRFWVTGLYKDLSLEKGFKNEHSDFLIVIFWGKNIYDILFYIVESFTSSQVSEEHYNWIILY